jgi:hypothetical protein
MTQDTLAKAPAAEGPIPAKHQALANQVQQLGASLNSLAGQGHAQSLLRMIRRPGWTSPPEAQLVSAMVGHLNDQLGALQRGHDALLSAADTIGKA